MTRERLLVPISIVFVCTPAFAHGDSAAGKEAFEEACERCHFEDDYADEAESVIKAMILAIMNGETKHRSSLSDLTEEDAANLAAYLAEQQAVFLLHCQAQERASRLRA